MLASALTFVVAGLASLTGASAQVAAWHMDSLNLLTVERLDPVVSPNQVAGHMHHIVGGSAFGAAYNFETQVASRCTTAGITADKSNYWMPKMYWQNDDGSFIPLPAFHRFYYFLGRNAAPEPVAPFPEGLRMLAGSPNAKSGNGGLFSFTCHVNSDLITGSIQQDNFNFNRDCPYGIRTEVVFPMCWNGVDLYQGDMSHVVYPSGGQTRVGQCPWTHPIRIPQIMLEYTWKPSAWAPGVATKGKLIWANGDTTGYGVHADFINGWDTAVLAKALNNTQCAGSLSSMAIQNCQALSSYWSPGSTCQSEKGQMNEPGSGNEDLVPIDTLPGCNPVWGASGGKPGCSSAQPSPNVGNWQGADGSLVATGSQNKARVIPTKPGWAEIGCIKDTASMLTGGYSFYDTGLSVTSCTTACTKSGYNYAAIGMRDGRWDCQCGTGIEDDAAVYPGMCTSACPGNSAQKCGAASVHSVYYAPSGTTVNGTIPNNTDSSYTGCYNPAGSSSLSSKITFQFTDTSLTTEGCLQICANKNATWGATSAGKNCMCGTNYDIGSGYYQDQGSCNTPCMGNTTQMCGWTYGWSVYDITKSSFTRQTIQHPAGWQGCFNDPGMGGLTGFTWVRDDMTAEQCVYGCGEIGYKRAGVMFGNRCRCDNSWKGGALYPYTSCQTPCSGNSSSTCGGTYNTEVYDTSVSAAQIKADAAAKPTGWIGCYANSAQAQFKDYNNYDGSLTAERCAATCKTYGYPYVGLANGYYCRCSKLDPTTSLQRSPSKQFCTLPCPGDSKQTCGSPNSYTDTFNQTALITNSTSGADGYKGCYSGVTGLTGPSWSQSDMTLKTCQTGCREMGYSLAGNSGQNCYCGNSWTKGDLIPDYSCTQACPGNSTQMCGASYITSLYESRIGADTSSLYTNTGYEGCYTDSNSGRALTGFSYTSSAMTNSICQRTCAGKGFALAGTAGQGCFCGNTITNGQAQTSSSLCIAKCPGDSSKICGDTWKLSVYNATVAGATTSAAPSGASGTSGTTSKGCFSDTGVLNNAVYTSGFMSIDQCMSYCKGQNYAFAGLSGGNQCRCGNTSPSVIAGRSLCNTACVSNSKQTCGGTNVVDVWPTSQSGSFKDAFGAAAADSTGSMGCWQDAGTRLLNGTTFTANTMTPTSCSANCAAQGYKFSGVENSNQCFCGNSLQPGLKRYDDGTCTTACKGDASAKCGGNWAINVRLAQAGNTAPTASPSASASSKASVSASASKSGASASAASATPSSAAIEGYKGCFGTGTFVSSASAKFTGTDQMTIGFCRRYCRVQGFAAAALQGGNNCYCGTTNTLGTKFVDSACTNNCAADSKTKCGDSYLASVYDTTGSGATTAAGFPTSYVGCFVDSSARILPSYTFTSGSMTSDICRKTCSARGLNTWGTQAGNQCFCGPSLPKTMTTDNICSYKCAGNASEMCGGSWKLSVYNAGFQLADGDAEAPSADESSSSASSSPSTTPSSAASVSTAAPSTASSASVPTAMSSAAASPAASSAVVSSAAASSAAASSAAASSAAASPSAASSADASPSAARSSAAAASSSAAPSSAAASPSASASTPAVLIPVSSAQASSTAASSAAVSSKALASSAAASSAAPSSAAPSSAAPSSAKSSAAAASPSAAPSPVQSAAPASPTNHLGCFKQTTGPVLNKNVIKCDTLTPGMCKLWCNSNSMTYAGMTDGDTCGCANDISSFASVSADQCNYACFSDETAMCGGDPGTYNVWKSSGLVARRNTHRRKLRQNHAAGRSAAPLHFNSEREILEYLKQHQE